MVNFEWPRRFFFQTGLVYEQRSTADPAFVYVSAAPHSSNFEVDLSYLKIPMLAGVAFTQGTTEPYGAIGFTLNVGLDESITNTYAEDVPSFVPRSQPDLVYDRMEYGVFGELGIRQRFGPNLGMLGFRYGATERTMHLLNGQGAGAVNLGSRQISAHLTVLFSL